jgi:tight adherence protein B
MTSFVLICVVFIALSLVFYQFSDRILDWVRFQSIGTRDYVFERLKLMMIQMSSEKVFALMAGASLGVALFVFVMLLPDFKVAAISGIAAGLLAWFSPKMIVNQMYEKRVKKFAVQMVDGLSLMSNGMRSGLSVVQAIGLVAQESESPLKDEFELMLSQNRLGMSVEDSFVELSRRIRSDDVEMFVTSVNILKATGGNLAETFDTISSTIRERIKMEQKIDAMTTQGKMQGYLLLLFPPMMVLMLKENDPTMFAALFSSVMGWIVVAIVIALEMVAFFLIRFIVRVDV